MMVTDYNHGSKGIPARAMDITMGDLCQKHIGLPVLTGAKLVLFPVVFGTSYALDPENNQVNRFSRIRQR